MWRYSSGLSDVFIPYLIILDGPKTLNCYIWMNWKSFAYYLYSLSVYRHPFFLFNLDALESQFLWSNRVRWQCSSKEHSHAVAYASMRSAGTNLTHFPMLVFSLLISSPRALCSRFSLLFGAESMWHGWRKRWSNVPYFAVKSSFKVPVVLLYWPQSSVLTRAMSHPLLTRDHVDAANMWFRSFLLSVLPKRTARSIHSFIQSLHVCSLLICAPQDGLLFIVFREVQH